MERLGRRAAPRFALRNRFPRRQERQLFEPRVVGPTAEALGRDARMRAIFAVRGAVSGRPIRFRLALDTIYRAVEVQAEGEGLA